jgi:hypothetical protein
MEHTIPLEQRHWARAAIARIARKVTHLPRRRRKALLVHLDGVPRAVLERSIAAGRMPFLQRLLGSGEYQLSSAFWGTPASTPSFQAGLLYGARHPNLPAYLWNDRRLGRLVRMNTPKDAAEMERRLGPADGDWLLKGGTTYLSLFRGGARGGMTMSSLTGVRSTARAIISELDGFSGAARRNALEYLGQLVSSTTRNGLEIAQWIVRQGESRHEREYWFNRFMMHIGWDLARKRTILDMVRGVPIIYLVFGTYDEISHRRGPLSLESSAELWRADAQLAELFAIAHGVENPYDVIFFTDHGHVDCFPFERRTGQPFARFLARGSVARLDEETERALLDGRAPLPADERDVEPNVVDAGNFAHVYFDTRSPALEARELLARHPGALARCATHPDVGICALRRGTGAVALIGGRVYAPEELSRAPLADGFAREAVGDLLRELPSMPDAGDLVLYGNAVQPGATVGFAWEFGSHGGLTRTETESLVIWPSRGPVRGEGLAHSVELHQRLAGAYQS